MRWNLMTKENLSSSREHDIECMCEFQLIGKINLMLQSDSVCSCVLLVLTVSIDSSDLI